MSGQGLVVGVSGSGRVRSCGGGLGFSEDGSFNAFSAGRKKEVGCNTMTSQEVTYLSTTLA